MGNLKERGTPAGRGPRRLGEISGRRGTDAGVGGEADTADSSEARRGRRYVCRPLFPGEMKANGWA